MKSLLSKPLVVLAFSLLALPLQACGEDWPSVAGLFKAKCVKCHGPAKAEGGLNLLTAADALRGGQSGSAIAAHDIEASLLWRRVRDDEMPPEKPLSASEKQTIEAWIRAGAAGPAQAATAAEGPAGHWSFQPLLRPALRIDDRAESLTSIDRWIEVALEERGVLPRGIVDRNVLSRRAALAATGLPPDPDALDSFLADASPAAYERYVDRLLASPHFGEKWGKAWLDAAGYADSNGYFSADTPRPLAWKYRDYVIRAFNAGKPFDAFVQEQLAGDELASLENAAWRPGEPASERLVELLTATHYLRNGQDGTGESDGNPNELRVDRYAALESCQQIVAGSLLGLTMQCAKCHDHKFEPIRQRDYYALQSLFYGVFPARHEEAWIKPQDRIVRAPLASELASWEMKVAEAEGRRDRQSESLENWIEKHRPAGAEVLVDRFDTLDQWSAIAPGDDGPAGVVAVALEGDAAPLARIVDGRLAIVEGGPPGDKWLCTRESIDWTPEAPGEAVQVSFDLVARRLDDASAEAERVGYLIAAHDFDDSGTIEGGNILIDGNPNGASAVFRDYPGDDARSDLKLGSRGYAAGGNYGVRITRTADDRFRFDHVVDGAIDENEANDGKPIFLSRDELPEGAFAFEFCCGRSFLVDNLRIERFAAGDRRLAEFEEEVSRRRKSLRSLDDDLKSLQEKEPGRIAWASAIEKDAYAPLLARGDYAQSGELVSPSPPAMLGGEAPSRLEFARWLTATESPAAGLFARVQTNRIWQGCFGVGLVAASENLGQSGEPPSHPELLEWLATEFAESGWDAKTIVRAILISAAFRRESAENDVERKLLAGFPTHRLSAESIRDSMLAASGELVEALYGEPAATERDGSGEVVVSERGDGALRRSLYLEQRRTEVLSMLQVFDAPSIVFHSIRRPTSAMPLQSLALLNSSFSAGRAEAMAKLIASHGKNEADRIRLAFRRAYARDPSAEEFAEARLFLAQQTTQYGDDSRALRDLCQSLFASSEFLYIE